MSTTQTEDQTYNGWTNYPTWAVNLWLSNDEGLYNLVREQARELVAAAPDHENVPDIWSEEQAAQFTLVDWLEDDLCSPGNDYGLIPDLDGFPADLLGWALGSVNWDEIAGHWITDLQEEQ